MMAFTSTIDSRPKVMGPLVLYTGTFTNDGGSTGGDVDLASVCAKVLLGWRNGNKTAQPTPRLMERM